jgi:hypothetical protein
MLVLSIGFHSSRSVTGPLCGARGCGTQHVPFFPEGERREHSNLLNLCTLNKILRSCHACFARGMSRSAGFTSHPSTLSLLLSPVFSINNFITPSPPPGESVRLPSTDTIFPSIPRPSLQAASSRRQASVCLPVCPSARLPGASAHTQCHASK